MAELMNAHEQKPFENLMAHNSAYYGYELSKGEIKTILQAFTELKKYRATTESEIRAKAYDKVCNAISNLLSGDTKHLEGGAYYKELAYLEVLRIVEQLKEE